MLFVIGLAVLFVFFIVFGYMILEKFNEKWQNLDIANQESKDAVDKVTTSYPSLFDTVFIITVVIFFLATIISAYFIDVHPIFFVVSLIVLIGVLVCAAIVAEANQEFLSNPKISGIIDKFPMMAWFSMHLFPIAVVMGGVIIIVLYAKLRGGEM